MGIALYGNPSQSYGGSVAIWDHTSYLPMRCALTPANQAGTHVFCCIVLMCLREYDSFGLSCEDGFDMDQWKLRIKGELPYPGLPGNLSLNQD